MQAFIDSLNKRDFPKKTSMNEIIQDKVKLTNLVGNYNFEGDTSMWWTSGCVQVPSTSKRSAQPIGKRRDATWLGTMRAQTETASQLLKAGLKTCPLNLDNVPQVPCSTFQRCLWSPYCTSNIMP